MHQKQAQKLFAQIVRQADNLPNWPQTIPAPYMRKPRRRHLYETTIFPSVCPFGVAAGPFGASRCNQPAPGYLSGAPVSSVNTQQSSSLAMPSDQFYPCQSYCFNEDNTCLLVQNDNTITFYKPAKPAC